jgi:serine phosphatase RsbU (regulator of sigma subunit)/transcriptional regulator with GAF, ATPase, and Fis domain
MNADLTLDLQTLSEIGRSILRASTDVEELAEVAFLEIARLIEADYFQLGVFREDEYQALIWVRDGNREPSPTFTIDPEREGLIGWIRRTGQPLLVRDYELEAEKLPAPPSYNSPDPPSSAIFVPLLFVNRTLGIIAVQSRTPAAFDETHLQLLQLIALTIAPSLAATSLSADLEALATRLYLLEEISRQLISLAPIQDRMLQVCNLLKQGLEYERIELYQLADEEIILLASTHLQSTDLAEAPPACVLEALSSRQAQIEREPQAVQDQESDQASTSMRVAVPLLAGEHRLGVLCLLSPAGEVPSEEQHALIKMIVDQLGIALLEDQNYAQHQEEAWITTVLLEVARHAAQPGDALAALQAVLQLATLLAGTDWAVLLLPMENQSNLFVGPTAGLRKPETFALESSVLEVGSFGLLPPFSESNLPIPVELPDPIKGILQSETALALIMSDGQDLLGLLLLQGEQLSSKRMSLLAGIGHQVSLRLENSRLIEEAAARRSMERELAMAHAIQASFLPETVPLVPGWELGIAWHVARVVGGDFYDFIPLPAGDDGDRIGLVMADVADKGIPAALYMALSRTLVRSVATALIDPAATLERVNRLLISDTRADLFVSVFYGVWEPKLGRIRFANAGHNPPILHTPGLQTQIIRPHGMVLGVDPDLSYANYEVKLSPGNTFVLYTDGVTEAFDPQDQPFGLSRLESCLMGEADLPAQDLADIITERVFAHQGQRDLSDDLTVLTLRRTA